MGKNEIIRFLYKARSSLNCILIFFYIFKALLLIGVVSGIIILLLRIIGIWVTINTWLIILLAGTIIGFAIALKNRMSLNNSARWLDSYLSTNDAFSAYLFIMKHDFIGNMDEAIVKRAENIIKADIKMNWPLTKLKKLILITTLCLIIIGLLSLWSPEIVFGPYQEKILQKTTLVKEKPSLQKINSAGQFQLASAERHKKIAKMLFPKDKNLSDKAEKALNSEDYKTLQGLINDYKSALKEQISAGKGPIKELQKELEQKEWISQMLKEDIKNKERRNIADNKNKSNLQEKEIPNRSESGIKGKEDQKSVDDFFTVMNSNKNKKMDYSLSKNYKMDNIQNNIQNMGNQQKINIMPGTGSSDKEGMWRDKKNGAPRDITLLDNEKDQLIEYINPGTGPKIPLSKILPYLKESAETAIKREDVPAEYQDSIGSYFIELSKEIK